MLVLRFFISNFLTCNLHSWKIHRHIVPHSTLTVDQAHPNLRAATMCDLISVAYMLVEDTSISFQECKLQVKKMEMKNRMNKGKIDTRNTYLHNLSLSGLGTNI
jgi:hypothetical protein